MLLYKGYEIRRVRINAYRTYFEIYKGKRMYGFASKYLEAEIIIDHLVEEVDA